MKKICTIAFMLLIGVTAEAQHTFIDSTLNNICKQALVESTLSYKSDINYMGAVIMESNTGKIIANVSVGYDNNKDVVDIPNGNNKPVHAGIGRAVLYLTLMDYLTPNFAVDAIGGIYKDSISECVITDQNYKFGGYGRLRLKEAFDRSDIGMIKAAEIAFNRNMGSYGIALRKTGIFFSDSEDIYDSDESNNSNQLWSPRDILGYTTYMSLVEQATWINAVANGGNLVLRETEDDPVSPMCVIKNKQGIDSLKSAMLDIVEEGLGRQMKSNHTQVAGIANVTPVDVEGNRGCLAIAFFPCHTPQYTVGVFVNKHGQPADRIIPTRIVGNIIKYMVEQYDKNKKVSDVMSASEHKQERLLPYER